MRVAAHVMLVGLLAAATPRPARAQVVRGDVTDAATHAPVVAAMVVAYDSAGSTAGGTFTDDSGRFALRVARPGHYRLRAERIGYAANTLVSFDLAAGQTVAEHLLASSVPVVLPTMTVTANSQCVVRPTTGPVTAALWEEARKALYAAQLGVDGRMVFAIRQRYRRSLDGTSLLVRWDSTKVDTAILKRPFLTPATPEELAQNGYGVLDEQGDSALTGPDADILLSDAFARTHCFDLRLDPEKHAGLVGLSFEPALKRHVPDVTGVIWLDSVTARLRSVEFRHTNLFPQVSPLRYGGRFEFEQLPGGVWIIRRWVIRLPILSSGAMSAAGVGDARYLTGGQHIARYHDDGGEVLSATVILAPPPS